MMLVKTHVTPSGIHGLGLFATEFIPYGSAIWRFEPGFDHSFSLEEFSALPLLARDHTRWFCFVSQLDGQIILSGDHACFINHSLAPNTGAPDQNSALVTTVALHDIPPNQEITCNYWNYDADTPWKLGLVPRDAPLGARVKR